MSVAGLVDASRRLRSVASSIAVKAPARSPVSPRHMDKLFNAMASSWVNTTGSARVSSLKMATASSIAAKAPARSPVSPRREDKLFNALAKSGVDATESALSS